MKWIFLKLFGRGEPERVRHLKSGAKAAAVSVGCPESQRSNRPTVLVGGVLPAEGSVLLDVLQRFKGGALRDEPSPGKRDGLQKRRDESSSKHGCSAFRAALCDCNVGCFSPNMRARTQTCVLMDWWDGAGLKSQSFHQNTLSAMSIKAKVHQFSWQTEEPFRAKPHSEQRVSISEQRVHISPLPLVPSFSIIHSEPHCEAWNGAYFTFKTFKTNAHRNVRQKSSSYVQPKPLERPLLVGWKTVLRLLHLHNQSD